MNKGFDQLDAAIKALGIARRRKATHATEKKMCDNLAPEIASRIFGNPTSENIDQVRNGMQLFPATGYWRHRKADVMSFTGIVKIKNVGTWSIGSWESMTEHLRESWKIEDQRGDSRAYADFMVIALD